MLFPLALEPPAMGLNDHPVSRACCVCADSVRDRVLQQISTGVDAAAMDLLAPGRLGLIHGHI